MPFAPARPCRNRCPRTTTAKDGLCDVCRPVVRARFDATPQRREHHAFYASKAWRAVRAQVLARDPICKKCGDRLSTVGAHKVPARMLREIMADAQIAPAGLGLIVADRIARRYGLSVRLDSKSRAAIFHRNGAEMFKADADLLVSGHDYALDDDAVEGWCKPCHDADSGREAHRSRSGVSHP
jgi:5-methylcytosine-specific restriction endonuclease McrA